MLAAWRVGDLMVERARRGNRKEGAADVRSDVDGVPADLERLAHLLDRAIRLPGNMRIGIDGLIGLIPGVGDAVGAILGFYIVSRATALGVPKVVLARMLLNVGVDSLVGAVPLLGDLFDFAFKANTRNLELMRRAFADGKRERRTSALVLGAVLLAIVLFAALIVALGILIARLIVAAF